MRCLRDCAHIRERVRSVLGLGVLGGRACGLGKVFLQRLRVENAWRARVSVSGKDGGET